MNTPRNINTWAKNKQWWLRMPILLYFSYLLYMNLQHPDFAISRRDAVDLFDFGVHELGHFIFMAFGQFMHILGGSLFQCIFPLIWLGVCIKRGWFFAACMCVCWFGINLIDVSIYAGDAKDRLLSLSCLGSDYDQCHDWYQILTRLHHLEWYSPISHRLHFAGIVSLFAGIIAGMGLILKILFSSFTTDSSGSA